MAGLPIIIEHDGDGFISISPRLALFGYGDDVVESIENLKLEIESLYHDLMEDDNFTPEWLSIKAFLKGEEHEIQERQEAVRIAWYVPYPRC
jgi:hypothetical protein